MNWLLEEEYKASLYQIGLNPVFFKSKIDELKVFLC